MKKNTKKAFTLAEVLMVIAIIGAVAVLAVPNLKTGISEDTNIAKLKATYNQLETAINAVIADYGSVQAAYESCGNSNGNGYYDNEILCFNKILTSKLDLKLDCGLGPNSKCFSPETLKNVDGVKRIDENYAYEGCKYSFILANGAAICERSHHIYGIDVDGPKKGPTIFGMDVFQFSLCGDELLFDCMAGYDFLEEYIAQRSNDGNFSISYDETAWAMMFGNMDYIKCASQLKWHSKTTCD